MTDNIISIMEYRLKKEQTKQITYEDYDAILTERIVKSFLIDMSYAEDIITES